MAEPANGATRGARGAPQFARGGVGKRAGDAHQVRQRQLLAARRPHCLQLCGRLLGRRLRRRWCQQLAEQVALVKLQIHWRGLQQPDEEGAEWMHGRRITFVQVMNDEERDWPLRPRQQPILDQHAERRCNPEVLSSDKGPLEGDGGGLQSGPRRLQYLQQRLTLSQRQHPCGLPQRARGAPCRREKARGESLGGGVVARRRG